MKVAELLESRRKNWQELEQLCERARPRLLDRLFGKRPTSEVVSRFAFLYRSACADLALAEAHQLPPDIVNYLDRLVGRAHNQLYRSQLFRFSQWAQVLLIDAPQKIFNDRCVQAAFVLFWGLFIGSAILAYSEETWPDYVSIMVGEAQIEQLETSFQNEIGGRDANFDFIMAAFYIQHNTGIGLKCFAFGLLVLPGLYYLVFNAAHLGACFGYMARPDVPQGVNFFHFVTAHGPFELTAIVLSAGAGLRLGVAWLAPGEYSREASLRKTAKDAMPLMGAAMVMFFLAALIEGFLSPSAAPYWFKASVAVVSSTMLMFYFIVLGYPRGNRHAI